MTRPALAVALVLVGASSAAAAPPPGYTATVTVSAPTRLDWTFTVTNRSLAEPPPTLLGKGYDSTQQSYELFLPPRKDLKQPVGAVVFVSAGDAPAGWKAFEPVCKELGLVFVGVRGAGNTVAPPRRCRIVLDCLDDLRRQVPLDPDRTYLSGFSGGGRIACGIAFALPEFFGGVLPLGAGGDLRAEPWLRHRTADRLSAALVTGQTDFNRGEVERWKGPYWSALGVRTKVWVRPNSGHAIPPPATLLEAVRWLDEGRKSRVAAAKKAPASRAAAGAVPTREDAAKALLAEGRAKLAERATQYRGLMLVKGAADRWPDTEPGKAARKLLGEYEAKAERPWEADDFAEQRVQMTAEARSLGDYALNGVPAGSPYEKLRSAMAARAIDLWTALVKENPDSQLAKEGTKLVAELRPLADKKK
jgi:hypothetical protein